MEICVVIRLLLTMHIFIFQSCASIGSSFSSSSSKTNNNTDMLALLALKSKIQLPSKSPILGSWNTNTSLCNWYGVSCSLRHQQRVSALNISYMNIHGTISPQIGNLSFLRVLNLSCNSFGGPIPETVGRLRLLRVLNFRDNQLDGSIPSTINAQMLTKLEILDLQYNHLVGTIPPSVLNFTTLKGISLSSNRISASISNDICRRLPKLEILLLSFNPLGGHIPTSLRLCRNLQQLELRENRLTGSIPTNLGCLSHLKYLNLYTNRLTGRIPASLGNLSNLESLLLGNNSLFGEIPAELGQLSNFIYLDAWSNNLSGRFPPGLFNLSFLEIMSFSENHLSGNLPELTGLRQPVPELRELSLRVNQFSGRIPDSISNTLMLKIMEFSDNSFNGPVPMTLGDLRYIESLSVENNTLTNHPSQKELHFLTSLTHCHQLRVLGIGSNPVKGAPPESIGYLSTSLEIFVIDSSQIQGVLPYQIGNLSGLLGFDVSSNDLVGAIPSSIGNLKNLQRLYLYGNKFQGNLPNEVCQLTSLSEFTVAENKLYGPIPFCIGNLTTVNRISFSSNAFTSIPHTMWQLSSVWLINLSFNSLNGYLPPEIEKLVMLQIFDVSENQLSATIPETLSNLKMLQLLNLSANAFQGNIPTSIVDLASLESLDLSSNNLSGIIPKSLEKLRYLNFLNLSFNMLSGPVPVNGVFANLASQSFMGNRDLSTNSSRLKLPPCPDAAPSKSRKAAFWFKYVLLPIATAILVALLLSLYMKCCRKSKNLSISSTNLSINLGTCTSPTMRSSVQPTISWKQTCWEVEAMALYTKELYQMALVLQYMPNGSLEKWLYNQGQNRLDILQRMNIMIDVASGLEYLHHGYSEPIVNCDLKPSSVLLDEDMVAHVGDFGIAKILAKYKSMTQTATLGTMGYIAPEFGLQGRVSVNGDVYSFGIMLLETFTRKNPRDEMFVGGLSLRQWVISHYPDRVMDVIDASIWSGYGEATTTTAMESLTPCLSSIIEIALQCSAELPEERPIMTTVVVQLKKMKHDMVQHLDKLNGQR
nr:probable LRR receptor-like serine/threonine-protein kinase At3g47570 [Ziziphus jujuba var. spinosa]